MSRSSYQYETSPRKYEPDYDIPRKRTQQTRRKNSTKKTTAKKQTIKTNYQIKKEKKKIEIKTTKNETTIKIEISDNAGGINEEIKNKIFDPYFTTKHQSKGTGLGLYICANLIKKDFAGLIYAENIKATINETSYKGTKFVIELPLSC